MTDAKAKLAQHFAAAIPHAMALGMRLDKISTGVAELSMGYDERFIGDPASGVIHGGAVFALMDTCCGAAVMNHPTGAAGTANPALVPLEALRFQSVVSAAAGTRQRDRCGAATTEGD